MGTSGVYLSMAETKKMIIKDFAFDNDSRKVSVASSANGKGGIWILLDVLEKNINKKYFYIQFVKMSHKNGETFYKYIGYEDGPYNYDVPLNWLNKIVPETNIGKEWVEKVRKYNSFNLIPGMKFKKVDTGDVWTTSFDYSKKFYGVRDPSGKLFKMDKDLLFWYYMEGNLA